MTHHAPDATPLSGRWRATILTLALAALCFKLALALNTFGTNDVRSWQEFLDVATRYGGIGLYERVELYNHPPFMIHVLQAMGALSGATGVPFPFWLRLPAILADFACLLLVMRLLPASPERPVALALFAIAPAALMIAGFHGNTDPLMIALVAGAVLLAERRAPPAAVGAALGAAMCIKIVPVIVLPVFVCHMARWRDRAALMAGAATLFLVGSLPYIAQAPAQILGRLFGYGSEYGVWGLSRITRMVELPEWLDAAGQGFAKFAVVGAVVAAAWWINRRPARPPLFVQVGFAFFLFMALSPGFGVQYLAWLLPWVAAVGWRAALLFHAASGVFLFLAYTYWAEGFPWHMADAIKVGTWPHEIVRFEILCWETVVVVSFLFWRLVMKSRAAEASAPAHEPPPPYREPSAG